MATKADFAARYPAYVAWLRGRLGGARSGGELRGATVRQLEEWVAPEHL